MPRLLRRAFAGAKYHITVRGNRRQRLFLHNGDRERFLVQLEESLEQYGVVLYAYVLMSNHYHLLIETPGGNVSRFMQRLNTAYGMYFRNRHRRPGHTQQGRFGGKLVEGESYLLGITRYIHLNPVKVGGMEKAPKGERLKCLRRYRWSSYRGYVQGKAEEEMVDHRWRAMMGGRIGTQRKRYRAFVESKLLEDDAMLLAAFRASRYAVGDEEFVARVEDEVRREREGHGWRRPDVVWPSEQAVSMERIKEVTAKVFGCSVADLGRHGHVAGKAKRAAVGLACRLTGLTHREVGAGFGITAAAPAHHVRMLGRAIKEDSGLRQRVHEILKVLGTDTPDI